MIYQAAVAMPLDDSAVATGRLQGQFRIMAAAVGATPDWSTLDVTGPTETPGDPAGGLFEWTARVAFLGGALLDAAPEPTWSRLRAAAADETAPISRSALLAR